MKKIKITRGQSAIVDDWWFAELNRNKWQASWAAGTKSYRAKREVSIGGKKITIYMHAVVARTSEGMETDHINHNTLDNREENLRVCTHSENQHNRGKQINNTSGYKGVFRRGKKWRAEIGINGKKVYLGTFSTARDAACVYDLVAKEFHGIGAELGDVMGIK